MARIDTRIFRDRHFAATPHAISDPIRDLCALVSDAEPVYVPCLPEGDAGECFFNVRAKVERDGGEVLYGWAIWEWRRVFVEAEHHVVWRSSDRLVDVTPHLPEAESAYSSSPILAEPTTTKASYANPTASAPWGSCPRRKAGSTRATSCSRSSRLTRWGAR